MLLFIKTERSDCSLKLLKLFSYVKRPWLIIVYLNSTKAKMILPDRLVISCRYRAEFGKKLNLKKPETFNEKLQWLKLYDRNPYYSQLVDKYEAKEIVAKMIGKEHIIPTYGIWNNTEDIEYDKLPESFVLKTTHDSHSIVICKDKREFDSNKAKILLQRSLKKKYFYGGREWPYKNVKPRIIAEQYMSNNETGLNDYKVHCFNGEPRFVLVCTNRYTKTGLQEAFYNLQWEKIPVSRPECSADKVDVEKPEQLEEMLNMSRTLSKGIPFVRVDFYIIGGTVYFGEMTFFPASGYKRFVPDEYDKKFGDLINVDQ